MLLVGLIGVAVGVLRAGALAYLMLESPLASASRRAIVGVQAALERLDAELIDLSP